MRILVDPLPPALTTTARDKATPATNEPVTGCPPMPLHRSSDHHFLAPADFDARFAPTDAQVATVRAWLEGAGLTVTDVPSDHLLLSVVGDNAALERATGVALHQVSWNGEAHTSVVAQPTVPADVAADVTTILGLDDLVQMRPHFALSQAQPHDDVPASGVCCLFGPSDAHAFYDNPTTYQGT